LECVGVVSDFTRRLDLKELLAEEADSPPVFFYPGSSIGNFDRNQALRLLRRIREHCGQRGQLLIGADLVKPLPVMEAAYNDSQGLTAAVNLNVLRVINPLLQADFNPDAFELSAVYDARNSRIEMRLIATRPQTVRLGSSAVRQFRRGEYIITEHSHKYAPAGFGLLLAEAGFPRQQMWTDARGWFGIFLPEPDACAGNRRPRRRSMSLFSATRAYAGTAWHWPRGSVPRTASSSRYPRPARSNGTWPIPAGSSR